MCGGEVNMHECVCVCVGGGGRLVSRATVYIRRRAYNYPHTHKYLS